MCFDGGPIFHLVCSIISVCSNMHGYKCNILDLDSLFERLHNNQYSLDVLSDPNPISLL